MLVNINAPEIRQIVNAAFGGYTGRTCKIEIREQVSLSGGYWDGGSKTDYVLVDLATMRAAAPQVNLGAPPGFGGVSSPPLVTLTSAAVIVAHSIFCGKDMGLTIYAAPGTMNPAMLPAPVILSVAEFAVLNAIAGLKSGPYRAETLGRVPQCESVIATLIERGFLKRSKVGATSISAAGRNARDSARTDREIASAAYNLTGQS